MPTVPWHRIDTVLLDMDGTLLDLYFDTYFWRQHVPLRYAQKHGLEVDEAKARLFPLFASVEGTIQWYCVDYWSRTLELDIAALKAEVDHLINVHPDVIPFLQRLRGSGRRALLVTNAHHKALTLKLTRTRLDRHLDGIVCAHDYGLPKEEPAFWDRLQAETGFDAARTLLVDDSLAVLESARQWGMGYLLAVARPDSRAPRREIAGFAAIDGFAEIMPPARARIQS